MILFLINTGANRDCHGKNADHLIIQVPVGTKVRNANGTTVGDLEREGLVFVAARGGAGGKGNHYFISDIEQAPKICEYGAEGEILTYTVELSSMAHIGLVRIFIYYLPSCTCSGLLYLYSGILIT